MSRIFTDEELEKMGRRTLDVLTETIDSGDKEKSKKVARRMHREFQTMHDLFCNWLTVLLGHMAKTYGEEGVEAAEREACGAWLKEILHYYEGKDFKQRAEMFVAGVKGHLGAVKVLEDDEKVTLVLDPCPSGGRIIRGETGLKNFYRLQKPQAATFFRKDFPPYCTHCPIDDMLMIEWTGLPLFCCEPAAELGKGPCYQHMYKDVNKVPERVYKQIGKTKRKPAAETK